MELVRSRDCVVLVPGDTVTVNITASLASQGWQGGQGMEWAVPVGPNLPTVTKSTGYFAGFALWGSDEISDQFVATTRQFPQYQYLVLCMGGWLVSTRSFEQYTYASRSVPGPLVPLVYNASDRLLFSLRGFWTKEDEWTLSGDPRAPNTNYVGYVAQVPDVVTSNYLTVQVFI